MVVVVGVFAFAALSMLTLWKVPVQHSQPIVMARHVLLQNWFPTATMVSIGLIFFTCDCL